MSWYKTGTIAVTNGSPSVIGTTTGWIAALQSGWALIAPNGTPYEIASINSDTTLTLAKPYEGASQSAQAYSVIPTKGTEVLLAELLGDLINNFQATHDGPGQGKFPDGTVALPGMRFATDEDTGVARLGANILGLVAGGVARARLSSTALQLDVPLTGTAVQSSPTDATTGKLLAAGAFGLGEDSGPALSNTDTHSLSGFYHGLCGAQPLATPGANPFPTEFGAFGLVSDSTSFGTSSQYLTQMAVACSSGNLAVRGIGGAGWSDWNFLYGRKNVLAPVSQSAGVPTGGLIEYGSNANGHYIRYADGTLICWKRRNFTAQAISTAYGGIFSSGNLMTGDALLPIAFKGGSSPTFYITASIESAAGGQLVGGIGDTGNFPASVYVTYHQSLTNRALHMNAMAIGRWY